ncbi:MAG: hypothetical protein ACYDIE_11000 [Candidatus Krumholzibacteriia bacterium]
MINLGMALVVCLSAGSSGAVAGDPCGTVGRLVGLVNGHGLLVLCAADEAVAGADSVCGAILGADWQTEFPSTLYERTSRASAAEGLDWVCARVAAMPGGRQRDALDTMEAWLDAVAAVEAMRDVAGQEAFATAVAFVPAVTDLFPRDEAVRAALGRGVGASLASAELAGLEYGLAMRLSHLSANDRARCLRSLWCEALPRGARAE